MLSVVPKGLQMLGLGSLVNAATTFIESGPDDSLIASDAYRGAGALGGDDGAGGGRRNSPITGDAINRMNKARQALEPDNVWNALVCGQPPPPLEPDERRGRRLDLNALWQRQSDCGAEQIAQLLTFEDGRLTLDSDELDRRLDMILGPQKDFLDGNQKEAIVGGIAAALGADPRTTAVIIGASETLLDSDNFSDAESFTEMLAKIANDDDLAEVLDMGTQFGVLDSMIGKAVELGIPQAIDHLLNEYQDDKQRCQSLLRNIRTAAINSELSTIEKAVDHCGGDAVYDKQNDIVELILRYYRIPRDLSRSDYKQEKERILTLIEEIDPKWNKKTFRYTDEDGNEYVEQINDLTPYTRASEDALRLLKKDNEHVVPAMIAPSYPRERIHVTARRYHPQVALRR